MDRSCLRWIAVVCWMMRSTWLARRNSITPPHSVSRSTWTARRATFRGEAWAGDEPRVVQNITRVFMCMHVRNVQYMYIYNWVFVFLPECFRTSASSCTQTLSLLRGETTWKTFPLQWCRNWEWKNSPPTLTWTGVKFQQCTCTCTTITDSYMCIHVHRIYTYIHVVRQVMWKLEHRKYFDSVDSHVSEWSCLCRVVTATPNVWSTSHSSS